MSHFAVLVLVDRPINRAEAEAAVEPLLAPYNENGEWFREGSRWDWWVIGGRFSGLLDNYDPDTDPANIQTCEFCEGTGTTTVGVALRYPVYKEWVGQTCIQCQGTGKVPVWPTQRIDYEHDVLPVARLDPATMELPLAVVTSDGKWHEEATMGWFGMTRPDEPEMGDDQWRRVISGLFAEHPNATAVVVDCHV